jgi:hypothetical protein
MNASLFKRRPFRARLAWLVAAVYGVIFLGGLPWGCLRGIATARAETVTGRPEGTQTRPEDLEFFEAKVRPLLVQHCAECHSAKAGDPEGGLSFDSRADFLSAEGVAVAGKPDESLLVKVVRYDGDLQMPPEGKLPAVAIETIEEWVRRGLPWPNDGTPAGTAKTGVEPFDLARRKADHWCWHPPRAAAAPAVKNAGWCKSDIDRYVLARLESAGIEPAAEASREVLVRRAAEILTGLPADPADIVGVTIDPDPDAFDRYIDRLLASPHYGERFARHWLDVARYGEARGHEFDYIIPNAWRYRDWVVKAFNDDLPYDQFVREQIAGDLMERPRLDAKSGSNESLVGTGFWFLGEAVHGPVDIQQDEADRMDNCIDTFGKAFLGLALGCARCHDHKFDAISNEDYYALSGMLMSSSYRQAPFETLEANREVARRLEAAAVDARRRLMPLVGAALGPSEESLTAGLSETLSDGLSAAVEAPPAPGETVIADYSRGELSTPIIADGVAWGLSTVPVGEPVLLPTVEGRPRELRIEPLGHARSDAIWSATKSTGERDTPPLGDVDRAGRVLRTPKVLIKDGVIWHRVRGHVQIFVVVDGHLLLQGGPIYGSHLLTANTGGEWKWIRQDLRKDLSWENGHVVHVEYAAIENAVSVAETVASIEQPRRSDPPRPAAVNLRLADAGFDWTAPAARRAVDEAIALAAARHAILADVQLVSATTPAILDGNGIDQYVLLKGSAARRGELSPRRFLEAIDGPSQPQWPKHSSGRRELADRVLDPANPLTTRVIVNRLWHHLFGRGLVPTTDNFGKLGEAASDPVAQSLLDTLAVRFREEGWSVKRLVKEIVTSSTWRMSGGRDPRAVEKDPLNLLLHHAPLRRLEAEAIRDKILAVSGRLDRTLGGPSVEVFITPFHDGRGKPQSGPLDGAGRRSIYTRIRRNFLPSFLLAFDLPVPFQAMGRRNVTNVPAQSLTLMNDPFVKEQATLWATKTLRDGALSPEARIDGMYREAFARGPTAEERAAAIEFLATQAADYGVSFADQPRHEATWADLAHALINTKEFIFVP